MARSPSELTALFGHRVEVAFVDTADEVWARVLDRRVYRLVVWQGAVIAADDTPGESPVVERTAAYDMLGGVVVEHERHADGVVIVRRAQLNGPMHVSRVPASESVLRRFRAASPWLVPPFGRMHRHYANDSRDLWVVSIDATSLRESGGKSWHGNPQTTPARDPAHAAEAAIADRVARGYQLRTMELLDEERYHEPPPLTPSADPYTAVDAAVTRVRELVATQPNGHFLVEELDLARPADAQRLADAGYDKFFIDMHHYKLGRWATLVDAPRAGSSLDYFFARYGSLTWIVDSAIDAGLDPFYCGNVSGGGWACLELVDTGYDTRGADSIHPGRGYATGRVFHGGWGRGGYIADRRVANADGEHPIYPFCDDGPIDDLMPETPDDPASIEPFGFWLERHVHGIASELAHRLPFVNIAQP